MLEVIDRVVFFIGHCAPLACFSFHDQLIHPDQWIVKRAFNNNLELIIVKDECTYLHKLKSSLVLTWILIIIGIYEINREEIAVIWLWRYGWLAHISRYHILLPLLCSLVFSYLHASSTNYILLIIIHLI